MYNLIVGSPIKGSFGEFSADRFPSDHNSADLMALPALVTPEVNRDGWDHDFGEQIGRLGHVSEIVRSGQVWRFRFTPNGLPPIPLELLEGARNALGLQEYAFWRTQWTVRSPDLYRVLAEEGLLVTPHTRPSVFTLPQVRIEPHKIAVMMDFQASFAPVWAALLEVGTANGWEVERADSIWENAKVMDDVALLLARSKVIVADLSGKNANVFYETGLAHMLGRATVLITQSMGDVPFDLRSERVLTYLPNAEGIIDLKTRITKRLQTLLG